MKVFEDGRERRGVDVFGRIERRRLFFARLERGELIEQLLERFMLSGRSPDGERIVRVVAQNLDIAVLLDEVVANLIEPSAQLFRRLIGDEFVLIVVRVVRLDLFNFRGDKFVLIRFRGNAQHRFVVLIALDAANALDELVKFVDHARRNPALKVVITRFVFRGQIRDGVGDDFRGRELFGRRPDDGEPARGVVVFQFDARHGAARVILDFARHAAFDVEIVDAVFFVGRRFENLREVRFNARDHVALSEDEHALILFVVGRRRLRLDARERGNDFGRQLFLNGNDFQSYVKLTVEAGRELNRRVYRRFRSVNDNRAGN